MKHIKIAQRVCLGLVLFSLFAVTDLNQSIWRREGEGAVATFDHKEEYWVHGDQNVSVVSMPHLTGAYLDSSSIYEESEYGIHCLDVFGERGGWEPKFTLKFNGKPDSSHHHHHNHHQNHNHHKFIFKPSHYEIEDPGGWMFRINKGLLYWQEDDIRPVQILNEYLAYQVDQVLGLGRVPTVIPFAIPNHNMRQALQEETHIRSWSKPSFLKAKVELTEDSLDLWVQTELDDTNEGAVVGTLQYMVPDVTKPFKRAFHRKQRIQDSFYGREMNTRSLFDFLVANIDRGNNNFLHAVDDKEGHDPNLPQPLVYIDQNLLTENEHLDEVYHFFSEPGTPDLCRFYYEPVHRLRRTLGDDPEAPLSLQLLLLEGLRENPLVSQWMTSKVFQAEDLDPLENIDGRRQILLDFVDKCIESYGFDHVFGR